MTTLDRTQLPAGTFNASNLLPYALHRVYVVTLIPGGGEQSIQDTATPSEQFQSATYQVYGGGWKTAYTGTLVDFKGGNLYIEFQGCCYVNPIAHQTWNNAYPPNPKFIGIRILVAGINVAESMGSGSGGCEGFRVMGSAQLPPGDLPVEVQWQGTPPGQDDPITEVSIGAHIYQFHIWSAKLLAVGRWR